MMAHALYTLLWRLLTPCFLLRLLWRSRRQPDYRRHWGERLGFYGTALMQGKKEIPGVPAQVARIWLHAVSVGEMRAAEPLVAALRTRYPAATLILTCMTPTGRATAQALYGAMQNTRIVYLPYDLPGAVARFLAGARPDLGLLLETEIWPNLLAAAQRHGIPVLLVNARLSRRSARGYARVAPLLRPALRRLAAVAAQSKADANRLALLGAGHIEVCGNLKFEVAPSAELLAQGEVWRAALGERPVLLAASTREGEEAMLIAVWQRLRHPDVLLVIAPRHPERSADIETLAQGLGIPVKRRSAGMADAATRLWLVDGFGELPACYRMADVAFVGGSLAPLGGQNLIEAAACACPVLVGPHTFNFARATGDAVAAGAARRIHDVEECAAAVNTLLENAALRQQMSAAALRFAASCRGATGRVMALIAAVIREKEKGAQCSTC
ncbi:MAG: lipid IV(A) 3-deoxy-D-manno-octulosonic acid transferase [Zoogloeaceae bacterium]|jgi:3-deoxy-D-manno-octulosonic-acid transferase|nr:lipid IV(A) 3-deoxy-D-manno-octulosonic acid transferase [Zoogloeaceae bacterium]